MAMTNSPAVSSADEVVSEGSSWKIVLYTLVLVVGLVSSQVSVLLLTPSTYELWSKCVGVVTMLCLSYIMIHVGYEFNIKKSKVRSYAQDYVIAMTAAGLPWLLVACWFWLALPGHLALSTALLIGRFSAPTSAGLLFSMLEAAGLKETWLFRKARILAIFDDLDTILLMIPLKVLIVGFKVELTADAAIVTLLMGVAWRRLHDVDLPSSWRWTSVYAALVATACGALHHATAGRVELEVLLPAFAFGCVVRQKHREGSMADPAAAAAEAVEERINTFVSTMFMLLVGLSMPPLFQTDGSAEDMSVWAIAFHVTTVTLLMTLGKMFLLFCYRREASLRTRLALSLGMCPRGEVGAGIIVISLGLGIRGPVITISVMSLAINLIMSSGFIMAVKHLAKEEPVASLPAPKGVWSSPRQLPGLRHRRAAWGLAVVLPVALVVANALRLRLFPTASPVPEKALTIGSANFETLTVLALAMIAVAVLAIRHATRPQQAATKVAVGGARVVGIGGSLMGA